MVRAMQTRCWAGPWQACRVTATVWWVPLGMTSHQHRRVTELFVAVRDLPSAERSAYLDRECGDAETRREVEGMVAFATREPAFLEPPTTPAPDPESQETIDKLTAIEEALYQTRNESRQDPLNFPIRLNNKLSYVKTLASMSEAAPTAAMIGVRDELAGEISDDLLQIRGLLVHAVAD